MKKHQFLLLIAPLLFIGKLSAQGCLPAGLTFSTQGQIDSFAINYPGCTKILGSITIRESVAGNITNLLGLSQIDSIGGDLRIGIYSGWSCLGNPSLTSLSGLHNLTYIGGAFDILCNPSLMSLSELNNLISIGANFRISSNDSLTSLSGLNNLISIGGYLFVNNNDALTSLSGLNKLAVISGDGLTLSGNDGMVSLSGMDNLIILGGYLDISANGALTGLSGLENLTSIGDGLLVLDNTSLTSLSGLGNLTSIGFRLVVRGNAFLTSLNGMDNLTSIGEFLSIEDNASLTSLSGLDSIAPLTITSSSFLQITGNPLLSICDVPGVCAYLQNGGAATISNNATGCNDIPEIEVACQSTSVKETSNDQANILVYPNPTEGILNFESDDKNGLAYSIYSSNANLMKSGKVPAKGQVDVSTLPNGMYFVKIIIDNQVVVKKILMSAKN